MMARLSARIERFYELEAGLPQTIGAADASVDAGRATDFGSGYGYADEVRELEAAAYYRSAMAAKAPGGQATESLAVYDEAVRRVQESWNDIRK
jgi:hypothetical protein